MSNLIDYKHPYSINGITYIKDYLVIIKNILRLSEKFCFHEYNDGPIIPIRWSIKKNHLVVDRCTDLYRDIEGIDLNNINKFFKEEKQDYLINPISNILKNTESLSYQIISKYNMHKNESKFFAYRYVKDECLFEPLGLYNRCQTRKRSGLYSNKFKSIIIDNSDRIINEFILNTNFKSYKKNKTENFIEIYNNFFLSLQKDFKLNISGIEETFVWKDVFNLNYKLNKGFNRKIIKDNIKVDKKDFDKFKANIFLYLLHIKFVNYLNLYYPFKKGLCLTDLNNNIHYKLYYETETIEIVKALEKESYLFKTF